MKTWEPTDYLSTAPNSTAILPTLLAGAVHTCLADQASARHLILTTSDATIIPEPERPRRRRLSSLDYEPHDTGFRRTTWSQAGGLAWANGSQADLMVAPVSCVAPISAVSCTNSCTLDLLIRSKIMVVQCCPLSAERAGSFAPGRRSDPALSGLIQFRC